MIKPILPLRPYRQHKHGVDSRLIALQRHITARGAADDEFAFAVFHGPPNLGAVGQDLDGFQNVAHALRRRRWVELGDVFKETVKVVKDFRGQFDAGPYMAYWLGHLAILRAAGLRAGSPFARAAR